MLWRLQQFNLFEYSNICKMDADYIYFGKQQIIPVKRESTGESMSQD